LSVLVVTADEEAARSLGAAHRRAGRAFGSCAAVPEARALLERDAPLVLVVDAEIPDRAALCDDFRARAPWGRLFVMAGRDGIEAPEGVVLRKPFDAAEVTELLAQADEMAALDQRRRTLETRARDLALLVDASFEAIVGLSPDGTVLSWNSGAAAVYGYRSDEITGRSIELLEQEPGAALARLGSSTRNAAEVRRKRRDGAEVVVLLTVAPLLGGDGFAEVSLDVTQRKRLERALEHGERLAAIGKIAAAMAHEIANPLMVIRAANLHVGLLAKRLGLAELAELAADSELAVERIAGFVQNVRGFSRRERPVLTGLPIRDSVEMALRLIGPRARESDVTIELEPGEDAIVRHDPPRLGQVVMNLASNAIDAAAEGGKTVRVRVVPEASTVQIVIDDTGPGIAAEVAGRLFEAFVTTKPPGLGTGLGLSIARQIVEDHGGHVLLGPRPEGGTRALVVLPLRRTAPGS
jgi:PAS domain S-box-containing protein